MSVCVYVDRIVRRWGLNRIYLGEAPLPKVSVMACYSLYRGSCPTGMALWATHGLCRCPLPRRCLLLKRT